ncbi:CHAT domain-containing protein [Actinokineospora cianjurensis]|uniref:CHAT domain-containing protein n=1 Tax=Actinokineospora cianjurensis TaxID=585224 RepID=A0A421B5W4_9PSEU|nr:CHAT domain-containing protein [Actinokineospora cianjurensis]RLK59610.1 CHAT domain-containing protein [Actinokineospora cianjurensis]
MKYPHLPPIGDDGAAPAWHLAATDLTTALELSAGVTAPGDVVLRAELLRRAGDGAEGLRLLETLTPQGVDVPLVAFALATLNWTQGDGRASARQYEEAARGYERLGDDDGVLAARTGIAREARRSYRKEKRTLLDAALAVADRCSDVHLLADLTREHAAWDLMVGKHDTALDLAEEAAAVHRAVGDRYLVGLADMLRARALNAAGYRSESIDLTRQLLDVADEIGSGGLKMLAVVYFANFLQRGVVVGGHEWAMAKDLATEALEQADDAFTMAELTLPLAHLHTTAGEFDEAARCLDEYQRLLRVVGGNQVSEANLLKARARLELARNGGMSVRGWSRLPESISNLWRVRTALREAGEVYREAGLTAGVDGVGWHIDLLEVLGAGHSKGARRLTSTARDALDQARDHLLYAEYQSRSGNTEAALESYTASEAAAVASGATMFAVAAAAGSALMAYESGDHATTAVHLRAGMGHLERIRGAVASGTARRHITDNIRAHYEQGMLLAARIGDGELVLEVAERLRTDRLAGLLRRGHADLPPDLADLLAEIAAVSSALAEHDPSQRGVRSAPRTLAEQSEPQLSQRLSELYTTLRDRTNDLFAETFGAEPLRMDRLADVRQDVLVLVPIRTADGEHLVSVWRAPGGACESIAVPVTEEVERLKAALLSAEHRERILLRAGDLAPLTRVLPEAFVRHLVSAPDPVRLVVIPTGWLWSLPLAAIPLSTEDDLLVDHADIVLAPSLRFLTALQDREPVAPAPVAAVSWQDTTADIDAPELDALSTHPDGHTRVTDPAEVVSVFVRGGTRWRTAVVAAHGNREPGLAHAILAGPAIALSAADFLTGTPTPPAYLSLASCHTTFAGDDQYEPLGLAVAALTAGATHVVSTTFEIGSQDSIVSDCLSALYAEFPHTTSPAASLSAILRDPALRAHRLYHWAALTIIGIH